MDYSLVESGAEENLVLAKKIQAAYGAIKPTMPPPALVTLQFVAREIMLAGSDARPTDIGQWKADVRTRSEKELPVKGDTSVVGNPQAGAGAMVAKLASKVSILSFHTPRLSKSFLHIQSAHSTLLSFISSFSRHL